jgi:guanylate kinase
MRELEQREMQMVMRLQNTQRIQASETQKLKAMRSSPGRSPNSQRDNQSQNGDQQDGAKYKPLVLCGPSGAGKSTFTSYLMSEASPYKSIFAFSVSSTTRQPRAGEKDGVHYHFTTREDFMAEVERGNFLEHNEVHGNYYGTHKSAVREIVAQGKVCVLDIDVKGAMDIAKKASKEFTCNYVFIQTKNVEELRARLTARGTETEETLNKRVSAAEKEMKMAKECGLFQKTLINDEKEAFIKQTTSYVVKDLYNLK